MLSQNMHRAKRRRHEKKGDSSLTQSPFIQGGTQNDLHSEDDSPREVAAIAYKTLAWCILCLDYQDIIALYYS